MARVHILRASTGGGLVQDGLILADLLHTAGHDVRLYDEDEEQHAPPCDVGIFLEHFSPGLLDPSRCTSTVFIPNMEYFYTERADQLGRFDQIWAKSQVAVDALAAYGQDSLLTHFAAQDLYDPGVPRRLEVLHPTGKSAGKHTGAVLEAWRRYPDLPPLYLTASWDVEEHFGPIPPGVTHLGYPRRDEVRQWMNRCAIALSPSPVEGWGHPIAEAALCQALVVTTDAPPMNEHIRPGTGLLIPGREERRMGHVPWLQVDPEDVARAAFEAAAMDRDVRQKMGQAARGHVLARNGEFARAAVRLIGELADR